MYGLVISITLQWYTKFIYIHPYILVQAQLLVNSSIHSSDRKDVYQWASFAFDYRPIVESSLRRSLVCKGQVCELWNGASAEAIWPTDQLTMKRVPLHSETTISALSCFEVHDLVCAGSFLLSHRPDVTLFPEGCILPTSWSYPSEFVRGISSANDLSVAEEWFFSSKIQVSCCGGAVDSYPTHWVCSNRVQSDASYSASVSEI